MQYLGIDLGSRQVKLVLMSGHKLIKQTSWHTGHFYRTFCKPSEQGSLELVKEALGITEPVVGVTTGYGRNHLSFKGMTAINEIKAHSLGAVYQTSESHFTLLDVGGQDVKVMKIRGGQLEDMNLNDKCAASCGRFLEQMAEVLAMPLEEMTSCVEAPVALSSTCAVFCESELIGKMAEGVPLKQLAAGVNQALYKRIEPLLKGFDDQKLYLSGGTSRSEALQTMLLKRYEQVSVLPDSIYNGAIGCCLFGQTLVEE